MFSEGGAVPDPYAELAIELDRSGPVPLYYQLAQGLIGAIERGEIPPGGRLENELELAARLSISRPTIRRAIQELVDRGLLVRRRGIGTQVVQGNPLKRQLELTSLHDDLLRSGRAPKTRVLLREEIVPGQDVLDALVLPAGSSVLHLRRLRLADDVPIGLLENFLPPSFLDISKDDLAQNGLYHLLRLRGIAMKVARQTVGARAATEEEDDLFQQEGCSPVLTMSRTLYDQSGRAVEVGHHSYPAHLYSFETTVVER